MIPIVTLTFEHEGLALTAAARLKNPVHSRQGRMSLLEGIRRPNHQVTICARAQEHVQALDLFTRYHDWSSYEGLIDFEPAEELAA